MARDIIQAIDKIKGVMPAESEWQIDLDILRTSCGYAGAELANHNRFWLRLSEIVNDSIVDEDWKRSMVDILTDSATD